ncbi:MAG: hypothetical protein JSV49_00500 [Thermoplasmata archaeon]|nr:MAG: hypothetical protein JSV49_00500 [Thermoplasmata archaeon]
MEVLIFNHFQAIILPMCPGYIDLAEISHLNRLAKGGGVYDDRLWRESYYFNMTDRSSGITFISTIGILPNRKLNTGFFLFMKDGELIILKPFIARERVSFSDYSFSVKGLKYAIEGTNWRLSYNSKKCSFDILFTPLNKIYSYIENESDIVFKRIGSQHYEQFGTFEGVLELKGKRITIGPCFGHRDHSRGIRDWSAVDRYRLFCCAFSEDFAFNLWEGSIHGKDFLKGYVFDGVRNTRIIESEVNTKYGFNGKEPRQAAVWIQDEEGREFNIDCAAINSVAVPPRQSILYENPAEMRIDGMVGYGLQEYLYHEPNPLIRFFMLLKLIRMM